MNNCLVTNLKASVNAKGLPVLTKIVSLTIPANTSALAASAFYNALHGKKVSLKVLSDSPDNTCYIRLGSSASVLTDVDSGVAIPFNLDCTNIDYCIITSTTGGTFSIEYTEVIDWGKAFNINNVGRNCFVDGTAHVIVHSNQSYANGLLCTPPISTNTKITFVPSNSTINLNFYGSDGVTWVREVSDIDTTQIYDASALGDGFIVISSNTSKHPGYKIIDDIEYI